MSRLTACGGYSSGYGHSCSYHNFMGGYYRISWSFDYKVHGSRLRFTRTMERDTDEKGARKFCKKWNVEFPEGETT